MDVIEEEKKIALNVYSEAVKYLSTLKRSLEKQSKFNNDLRYGICVICFEKLFVAYTAYLGFMAEHHMPLALYNEAAGLDKEFPIEFKTIAQLVSKFESICSLDGFGYKTPTDEDLKTMILGLIAIDEYIAPKINS
jgi:hypothetical protein